MPTPLFKKWGALLSPGHFSDKIALVRDADGNRIEMSEDGPVLYMGDVTSWREWRTFLWNHVQPYVLLANVRLPVECFCESDGYARSFRGIVRLKSPGLRKCELGNGEDLEKMWNSIF